jgi:diguanylate cyclase (GGDEF)-like protein/PAS domain S-box-containing protein
MTAGSDDEATLWRIFFEQSRDGIVILRDDGSVYSANKPFAAMLGYTPAELERLYVWDWEILHERSHILEMLQSVKASGDFFETRHQCKDSHEIEVEITTNAAYCHGTKLIFCHCRDITDRKSAETALRQQHRELDQLQHLAHLGSWVVDFRHDEIRCSDETYRIFGITPEKCGATQAPFMASVHPDDREDVEAAWAAWLQGAPHEVKHRVVRPDGNVLLVQERGEVERDDAGKPLSMLGIVQDITELNALEERLREEKHMSDYILSSLPGTFYMMDSDGCLVKWNDQTERVTGRDSAAMKGASALDFFPEEEQPRIAEAIQQAFAFGSALVEARMKTVSGDIPYFFNGFRAEMGGGVYLLGVGLDMSQQKRLAQEAITDHLTGIYNRQYFDAELEKAVSRHHRYGSEISLVLFDIDHFKAVNDTFGHYVGDRVLVALTERVGATLRGADTLARWGGEEFVILLPDTALAEASAMAERVRRCIEADPFPHVGPVTISLGVTAINGDEDADQLFKRLDTALYEAKQAGRNCVIGGTGGVTATL